MDKMAAFDDTQHWPSELIQALGDFASDITSDNGLQQEDLPNIDISDIESFLNNIDARDSQPTDNSLQPSIIPAPVQQFSDPVMDIIPQQIATQDISQPHQPQPQPQFVVVEPQQTPQQQFVLLSVEQVMQLVGQQQQQPVTTSQQTRSEEEIRQEMRRNNAIASRRYRDNRKNREKAVTEELAALEARNIELKARHALMAEIHGKMKEQCMSLINNNRKRSLPPSDDDENMNKLWKLS